MARYMTAPQIEALFWHDAKGPTYGKRKACERRLRMLTQHELIRRIQRPVKGPEGLRYHIYALDKAGAEILSYEIGIDPATIDWQPKHDETTYPLLQHTLETTDFRVALIKACEMRNATLFSWSDEKELKSQEMHDYVELAGPLGGRQKIAVIPDAAFVILNGDKQANFCVEIDRGTVTIAPKAWHRRGWTQKVRAYIEYYQSGAYQRRYQTSSLLVLTVTTSQERLEHMKRATEEAGGDSRFLFTTFESVQADLLLTGKIWYRAGREGTYSLLSQDSPSQSA